LGKGSFGKVFLVRPITSMIMMGSDKVFAMKVLKKVDIVKKHQVDHTKTERFILENINHPFVLKLRYAFQTKQKLFMVTDYCSGGELFFHLKKMKKFTESMTTFYAGQISIALKHLHENNIIYRDLKPENILLDSYGNCKITDFGLSKVLTPEIEGKRLTFCGTPEYLAPEVLIMRKLGTTSYSFEVDWWGLGVVCFELMTGWPPFNDRDFSRLCQKILNDPIKFPSKLRISLDGQNIINQLLARDPAKRLGSSKSKDSKLSFEGLMNHPFFSHINWNDLRACRVTPPFIPNSGKNEEDTRNFDKEFTRMTLKESPGDPSPIDDNVFNNFSFNDNSRSEYSLNGMNSNHLAVPIERDNRPYMSADRDSIVRLSETIVDCSSSPLVTTVRGNQEGDDLVSRMLG
jgi:serine/threonine protein kinase